MDNNDLEPWLSAIPETTSSKLLDPAAEQIGKGLGGIASFIANPFIKLGIISDTNIKNFEEKMIKKNNSIPFENLDDSKQGLALKAIEDSFYQLESEELQEMFTNLIAASLDNRKNEKVSPAFSSVLKDLTPLDARVLATIYNISINKRYKVFPIVSLVGKADEFNKFLDIESDTLILGLGIDELLKEPVALSSLERLGLIDINRVLEATGPIYDELYESYKNNVIYQVNEERIPFHTNDLIITRIEVKKGILQLTHFGRAFSEIVIAPSL